MLAAKQQIGHHPCFLAGAALNGGLCHRRHAARHQRDHTNRYRAQVQDATR
jgi:hypothetical protein